MEEWVLPFLPKGAKLILTDTQFEQNRVYSLNDSKRGLNDRYGVYGFEDRSYLFVVQHYSGGWNFRTLAELRQPDSKRELRDTGLYRGSVKEVGGTKWGYIDHKGKFVLPPVYDEAHEFQKNGLAIVQLMNRSGVINSKGYYIVKPKYDSINPFTEGRATVITESGFKVIDENGREITDKFYSFIGDYHEGRALIAGATTDGKYMYGYLNRQGREVTSLQFESATDFIDGKAVVKLKDYSFALIGLTGKILATYPHYYVGHYGDGLLAFQQKMNDKYGYMDEQGNVIIEPSYTGVQPFINNRAIVNSAEDYQNQYGLIDRKGKYIIPPKYNEINWLGENRVAIGRAIDSKKPFQGSVFALGDTDGHLLTGFLFNSVAEYENGMASANDDGYTFFIDLNGKRMENLPSVSGSGTLQMQGVLIEGNIDLRLYYFDKAGNMVWKQNIVIPLNQQYSIREKKFKPNKDYLIYYPQVEGLNSQDVQTKVNQTLAEMSGVKKIDPHAQLDSNYIGDFEVPFFKKSLVVIKISGYDYPFGAAHGMPMEVYAHINLQTGQFYTLRDLFKQGSGYVKTISEIVGKQIKNDEKYSYVFPDTYKGIQPDQHFYLTKDALNIYFNPYEIAPYAAGFPTFTIPFEELTAIIDKQGSFWRTFH